jgi:carbamoyl-phosphate synthase large subunit
MSESVEVSPDRPVLLDRFLDDATEVDVDCICDGELAVIGSIMEHIEQAGVHSGDSACVIPPYSLSAEVEREIAKATKAMAKELGVRGLMNVQFAVKDGVVYVLEVNPRASRTVPFVSKTIGVPLAKLASRIMAGETLAEVGFTAELRPDHVAVKEAVFPFSKFLGVDILLGPEMKSTGEVMGIGKDVGVAYAKTQIAAGPPLPNKGNVFVSVRDSDKPKAAALAIELHQLGFTICASSGTAKLIKEAGVPVTQLLKLAEGRPNVLDLLKNKEVALVINTPAGPKARADEVKIRTTALYQKVPVVTTMAAAQATVQGLAALKRDGLTVQALQDYHNNK